jgi:hypothetical protein
MNKQDLPRSQTTAVLISILYSQGQWRQLKSKDLSSAAGSKRLVLVHTDHPVISATLIIYTHLSHQENSTPRTVWRHLNSKEVLDVRTTLVLLQIHQNNATLPTSRLRPSATERRSSYKTHHQMDAILRWPVPAELALNSIKFPQLLKDMKIPNREVKLLICEHSIRWDTWTQTLQTRECKPSAWTLMSRWS